MDDPRRLELGLASIRLTTALFLLPWVLAKFAAPKAIQGLWAKYYFVESLPFALSYAFGALQLAVLILFALGLLKTLSYGAVLAMHALSTLSTWRQLLAPGQEHNILFFAAIPVVAALFALFLLRERDRLLCLGATPPGGSD